jgi:hypothetical protein
MLSALLFNLNGAATSLMMKTRTAAENIQMPAQIV